MAWRDVEGIFKWFQRVDGAPELLGGSHGWSDPPKQHSCDLVPGATPSMCLADASIADKSNPSLSTGVERLLGCKEGSEVECRT
eukprot:CAMPEP_0117659344 /NCGR_PEP_ID=MMETSP0804-20121206/6378_1 /TAXON_ID=1074897 /ORGANISM="Tetraselmis astigmatica, Strain CCMP880" /LENGTH=83 /DNA_ID=CAMNT_0005465987 /DNA_START=301 /DNA_END=553 /DNA_ORIENTATION=+